MVLTPPTTKYPNHGYKAIQTDIFGTWDKPGLTIGVQTIHPFDWLWCYVTPYPPVPRKLYRSVRGIDVFCGYKYVLYGGAWYVSDPGPLETRKSIYIPDWPELTAKWYAFRYQLGGAILRESSLPWYSFKPEIPSGGIGAYEVTLRINGSEPIPCKYVLTRNFAETVYAQMLSRNAELHDTSGAYIELFTNQAQLDILPHFVDQPYGIILGTSAQPPATTDLNIVSPIAAGWGPGQLHYYYHFWYNEAHGADPDYWQIGRDINNYGNQDVTFRELALVTASDNYTKHFLLLRLVLDAPYTIPAGQTIQPSLYFHLLS